MNNVLQSIWYVLSLPLIPVGKTQLTVGLLLYLVVMSYLLITASRSIRNNFLSVVLAKTNLDPHIKNAVADTYYYFTVAIGLLLILNTAGIDLTSLTVVVGALGLGLSLGLQTVAKNMAGGFMILYEKPIKIGDRVQIGDTIGEVTRIALRATTISTEDGTAVTVPNADFMSNKIINWTNPPKNYKVSVPVHVSNKLKIDDIKRILLKVAAENPLVSSDPPPEVIFDSFEDSKIRLILKANTQNQDAATGKLRSELYYAIFPALCELAGDAEKLQQVENAQLVLMSPQSSESSKNPKREDEKEQDSDNSRMKLMKALDAQPQQIPAEKNIE
ncbi:MAG: mechanosensitive ion channel [Candidatus Obscuribacterales bacterium]|nr:mechanosensitive ion channel [Candidatus Obscuribacterales bacterium]